MDYPNSPIKIDAALNEYHIIHDDGGQFIIRYCPFCGRKAPKSRRGSQFHRLTETERYRLIGLTREIHTLDEVFAVFGQPDSDNPSGIAHIAPERHGKPETTEFYRTLMYSGLSDTADVYVQVYPTGKVSFMFSGKHKGPSASENRELGTEN